MHPAGTLVKWSDYPFQNDKITKDRYFLVLGKTRFGQCPVLLYMFTSTTQLQYYKEGEQRAKHSFYILNNVKYGLPEKCLIDFDMPVESVSDYLYSRHEVNIIKISKIDEHDMKEIWQTVLESDISPILKKDFHESLNIAGYTGLKRT